MSEYILSSEITRKIRQVPTIYRKLKKWYSEKPTSHRWKYFSLISFLAYEGSRVSEALSLKWNDIDFERKIVYIPQLKKKKKVIREVPLHSKVLQIFEEYQGERNGKIWNLTRQAVYSFLKRNFDIHPHILRHFAGTMFYKKTKDIEKTRRFLGHAGYNVIKVYVNLTTEDLREDLEQIEIF